MFELLHHLGSVVYSMCILYGFLVACHFSSLLLLHLTALGRRLRVRYLVEASGGGAHRRKINCAGVHMELSLNSFSFAHCLCLFCSENAKKVDWKVLQQLCGYVFMSR